MKVVVIYHTRYNSVEKIAAEIAIGIESVRGITASLIQCSEAQNRIEEINSADAIVFGSPTYFGSVSSEMKTFLDSTGDVFMNKKWKDKVAAAFTHSSLPSGDKLMTLNQMMVFAMQNGMIWCGLDLLPTEEVVSEWSDLGTEPIKLNKLGSWMGLMSQSDARKGVELSNSDFLTARLFGKRIATIAKKIKN
jgi:NAD(P)H dehydrogenase (quinone)